MYLNHQIAIGSYVPIQVSNGKQVYVKAQLVDGLKAVEALQSIDPTMKAAPVSDIASSLKKVCAFLEKRPLDIIQNVYTENDKKINVSVMKKGTEWKAVDVYAGGSSTAHVCDGVATKIYRERYDDAFAALKERTKQGAIENKIDPNKTLNVLGVFLAKPQILGERKITTLNLNAEGTVTSSIRGSAHEEVAFKGDLISAKIPQSEISSVCACLVQGSKTLLNNEIYHLDVKRDNMAYLGNGRAGHFDIAQSVNCNNSSAIGEAKKKIVCTKGYVSLEDLDYLKTKIKEGILDQPRMSQMHIYGLGMSLFNLLAKYEGEMGLLANKLDTEVSEMQATVKNEIASEVKVKDDHIKGLLKIYTPEQAICILKMTDPSPEKRPTIDQVEEVFPKSSIMVPAA